VPAAQNHDFHIGASLLTKFNQLNVTKKGLAIEFMAYIRGVEEVHQKKNILRATGLYVPRQDCRRTEASIAILCYLWFRSFHVLCVVDWFARFVYI
jgi:hypothetical protein